MNRLSSLMKVSYCASGRPALLLLLLLMLAVMPTSVSAQVLERWVYVPANFLVPEEVQRVEKIMTEASKLGFTHLMITDSKFCRLHEMLPRYFDHLGRIKTRAKELNLKLVPCVFPVGYSNDLLSQNVHLADGLPVRDALFEVLSGEARLVADPEVALPSFRDRKEWNFIDDPLKSDGDGLRVTDPTGENCRTMKAVKVTPYRHYHVSVKIKTEDFKGQPQVMILDSSTGRRLNHTNLKVGRTQDWSIQHITFNSLGNETVNLYIGAWGPTGGSMWLSEPQLEECGLLNVLRRDGTPVIVRTDTIAAKTLTEGVDFEHVSDPQLGNVPYAGEFEVFHASPSIRMKGTWKKM